jgi:hypothetical protein
MAAKNSCHLYFRYNRINNYPVIRSDENAKGESVRTEAFNAEFVSGMWEGHVGANNRSGITNGS